MDKGRETMDKNLKIVMSMFCEGKMDVEEVVAKIPYQHLEDFLDDEKLINADRLDLLGGRSGRKPRNRGGGRLLFCG